MVGCPFVDDQRFEQVVRDMIGKIKHAVHQQPVGERIPVEKYGRLACAATRLGIVKLGIPVTHVTIDGIIEDLERRFTSRSVHTVQIDDIGSWCNAGFPTAYLSVSDTMTKAVGTYCHWVTDPGRPIVYYDRNLPAYLDSIRTHDIRYPPWPRFPRACPLQLVFEERLPPFDGPDS